MLKKKTTDTQKQKTTSQSRSNVSKPESHDISKRKLTDVADYSEEYSMDIAGKDITANKARSNNNASRNSLQSQKNETELGQDMISSRLESNSSQEKSKK